VARKLLPEEGDDVQLLVLGQDELADELPRRIETLLQLVERSDTTSYQNPSDTSPPL
jgi:hypothetical protein